MRSKDNTAARIVISSMLARASARVSKLRFECSQSSSRCTEPDQQVAKAGFLKRVGFEMRSLDSADSLNGPPRCCGAPMLNLAQSASFHSREKGAPSNQGIKHLAAASSITRA